MIKIRLTRSGSKHNTFFRIVATDESNKRSGENLEILGYWQPSKSLKNINIERVKDWIKKGALVTEAVEKIIKS